MGTPFNPLPVPATFCSHCEDRLDILDLEPIGDQYLATGECPTCKAEYQLTYQIHLELLLQHETTEIDPLDGANRAESAGRSGEDGPACFWL